ncbi:MAG: hypothetical protein R2699_05735 [Acidimicrobiales bacterium]
MNDGAATPSSRLRTLPAALRGSGSRRTTHTVGTLYGASVAAQWAARSSVSSATPPSTGTTTAATSWPCSGWSTPMTAHSATAGWASRHASTSIGETFSPERMIRSRLGRRG